eukprot:10020466-Alexandrium_andersonii.AAC.1
MAVQRRAVSAGRQFSLILFGVESGELLLHRASGWSGCSSSALWRAASRRSSSSRWTAASCSSAVGKTQGIIHS